VSAPEARGVMSPAAACDLASCAVDIVEVAAFRGRASELPGIARDLGLELAAAGRVMPGAARLSLCVRPGRWLLLLPPDSPGAQAALWQRACAGVAAVVDHSSGLVALHLGGPEAAEILSRGCRLDLDPEVFPPGSAAATLMAQVSVILARLPAGLVLLTPASTARHFREWLTAAGRPFGLMPGADVTVAELSAAALPPGVKLR
jgi:heterotetrameric sarcosine oxidase gamma subunit